jgi:hypothetical protein
MLLCLIDLSLRCIAAEDPFANAKGLVKQSRDRNIANNYGMVAGSYKAFSGERTFTAANTSTSSAYHITAPTKPTPAQSSYAPAHVSAPIASAAALDGPAQLGPPTASYGAIHATSHAPTGPPAAPSRAPPPLPSAPPPSVAPPPVPVPSVVPGFGSSVTAASMSSYGTSHSASSAHALGTYNSAMSASTVPVSSYTTSSVGGSSSQPVLGAFQSSFGSTGSLSTNTTNTSAFGTPMTPLDSGMSGFGGSAAGGVPSVYNPTAHAPAQVTSLSSGPLGDAPPEKRSSWTLFGGKKATSGKEVGKSGHKDSLMDAPAAELYQPPVVPGAMPAYSGASASTGMGGTAYGGGSGLSAGPNDLDDFLNSFGKSAAPAKTSVPNAPASAYSGHVAAATLGATFNASPTPAFRSSFGASTGSYSPTPATSTPAPSAASSGLTLEQQIAAAQAEIARLSTGHAPTGGQMGASSAWPSQPATQTFGYGAQMGGGMPAAGYGYQSTPVTGQPGGYYGGGMGSGGYAAPQPAGAYGYAPPPGAQGMGGPGMMNNMPRAGMQPMGQPGAAYGGAYQPPMGSQSAPANNNQAKADPFDFLS